MDIPRKNDEFELLITDFSDDGSGIGRADGFTWFVKDACIGDRVLARAVKVKRRYGYAKLTKVLEASPDRVTAPCPHARACGGCQLMQLDYAAQLRYKENKVRNHLERIGGQVSGFTSYPIIGMGGEPPLRYRNKLEVPFGLSTGGRVVTGFYAGRTHCIVETDDCLVSPESDRTILAAVRNFIEEKDISIYDEKTHTGLLRHILIRHGFSTGEIMVCAVINGEEFCGDEFVTALLGEDLPGGIISSICVNINKSRTNVILGRDTRCLYGHEYITDRIGELSFRISAQSFYQINPVQTEKLYATVLDYAELTGEETIWDLYCGTGTIALFLAGKARKVYGVEIVPSAVENARDNAGLNNIGNVEFICGKAEEVFPAGACEAMQPGGNCEKSLNDQIRSKQQQNSADVVILDPPRKGCEKKLLEAILRVRPSRIVYVSCDSATLARDIKILTEGGMYHPEKVQPVDMFPHTVHTETVVLMSRVK